MAWPMFLACYLALLALWLRGLIWLTDRIDRWAFNGRGPGWLAITRTATAKRTNATSAAARVGC